MENESVIRFSRRLQIYAYRLSDRSWRDEFRIYWWCEILNSETEPTVLVGVVEGSPSSTESSLIETSITVPAVNAAFYAYARGTTVSRCHRLLLFWRKEFILITSSADCCSFWPIWYRHAYQRCEICDTSLSPRAISFHCFCIFLENSCSKWEN